MGYQRKQYQMRTMGIVLNYYGKCINHEQQKFMLSYKRKSVSMGILAKVYQLKTMGIRAFD